MKAKRKYLKALLEALETCNYRFRLLYNGDIGTLHTPEEISRAIPLTDLDRIIIYNQEASERIGTLFLIYDVNEPEEVVADWSGTPTFMRTMNEQLERGTLT